MKRILKLGTIKRWEGGRSMTIFCKVEFNDGELSISGVEGPLPSGNCLGACGQIDMHLRDKQGDIKLAKDWTREMLAKFFDVWKRWHLNDMKAGTPAQEAELAKHEGEFPGYPKSHYEWACEVLKAAGLLDVPNPIPAPQDSTSRIWPSTYRYGSAWLREEVPADVIAFLESLPESDTVPSWV